MYSTVLYSNRLEVDVDGHKLFELRDVSSFFIVTKLYGDDTFIPYTVSSFNFFVKKERKIDTYGKFLLNYECIRHTVFGRFALSVLLNCSYLCGVYRKYRIFIFITGDYYLLYNTVHRSQSTTPFNY
jgi:hypothetical protein